MHPLIMDFLRFIAHIGFEIRIVFSVPELSHVIFLCVIIYITDEMGPQISLWLIFVICFCVLDCQKSRLL